MSIMPTWSFGRRRIVITASVWVRRCAGDRKPDRGYIRYVELLCQEAKAVRGRLTRCALRRPFRLELSPSRITLFSSLLSVSRHCSRGGWPFSTLVFFGSGVLVRHFITTSKNSLFCILFVSVSFLFCCWWMKKLFFAVLTGSGFSRVGRFFLTPLLTLTRPDSV